jgi:hypothetical protein
MPVPASIAGLDTNIAFAGLGCDKRMAVKIS